MKKSYFVLLLLLAVTVMGCPPKPTVENRVLLLTGGAVGIGHDYYLNAERLLRLQGVPTATMAIDDDIVFTAGDTGLYNAIVITDYGAYAALPQAKREALDDYCRDYGVGQIFIFVWTDDVINGGEVGVSANQVVADQRAHAGSGMLWLAKDNGVLAGELPSLGRLFTAASSNYVTISSGVGASGRQANVLLDSGSYDGIRRVFFGHDFVDHWQHDLLYLDAVHHLSPVETGLSRVRCFGVDIDDIFQPNWDEEPANRTVKLQAEDVAALLSLSDSIAMRIGGPFRFTLGYNVGWYEANVGGPGYNDVAGDHALVAAGDDFYWFDHFIDHQSALTLDQAEIEDLLAASFAWAAAHDLDDNLTAYHLPPYNAGTYPVYQPLYDAYATFDLAYTSSVDIEEGFVYQGVSVVPRMRSGLLAEEYSFTQIDAEQIDALAEGGAVFKRLAINPVALFVTHQANFARDRIGARLIDHLIDFTQQWTNITLIAGTNDVMIDLYFSLMTSRGKQPLASATGTVY